MKVHLVDGTYELFRAYFGAPAAQTPTGQEVGATVGFLRSLASLLRDPEVTHVACAFDHEITSFRNDLFDGYKTGEGIEPELFEQFPLAEEVSTALGCVTWPMVEFEADDALAAGAARFAQHPHVEQVVLCSPDKDLAQCVTGDKVVLWDRRRERILNAEGVLGKYGVEPASIPDWLALVGDSADGIPGLRGFGQKTAGALLREYLHIESIPADADDWNVAVRGKAKLAQALRDAREQALLYRRLATLRVDVPLPESLEDMRWKGPRHDKLQALLEKIGRPRLAITLPAA